MTELKYCHKCGQTKPITDFYPNNRGGCKKCVRAYQNKYYKDHYAPEKKTDPEGFRTCSICHELKPITYFYRDKSNISGYSHRCKACGDVLREARRQKERAAKKALREVIPEGFKRCSKCNELLALSEFYQVKSGPNAGKYQAQCKGCTGRRKKTEKYKESQKAYAKRPEVRARRSIVVKAWLKSSPERIAKEKARRTKYRKRDYVKAKNKAWNEEYRSLPENQEKARQRTVEWRKANPEKERHHALLKAYRKKNAEGYFDHDQWITLLSFYKGYCPCCGEEKELTRDHIIPLNKGGTNWVSNIQGLCRSCNSAKGNHHTTDYRPLAARLWADSEMDEMGVSVEEESDQFQQLCFDFA